jgi:hypothetical protein
MDNSLRLLRNGISMPRVGLGTFKLDSKDVPLALDAALACGLRCGIPQEYVSSVCHRK